MSTISDSSLSLGISDYSDKDLLDGSADRFPESDRINELVSRYMKTVFAFAAKYASSADYEDLVSDGMLGLLGAIRSYDPSRGEFAAYAAVCIDNRMKSSIRRYNTWAERISDSLPSSEELERVPDPSPTPEDLVIRHEDDRLFFENIKRILSTMELRCIECVIMGLSYEEIASRLGTDKKAVDNALSRARTKLRRCYKP